MKYDRHEKETFKDILVDLYTDLPAFCKSLFGDTVFTEEFSSIHYKIFDAITDDSYRYKLVLAPRGFGKTSIARGLAMDAILFGKKHFIVYVSNTAPNAIMQTENIKRDLRSNKTIITYFGDLKNAVQEFDKTGMVNLGLGGEINSNTASDESFAKTVWVAFGRTLVLPRGCGQQIRGLNWDNKRPDLVILDDVESIDDLMNENTRKKTRKWFFGDVSLCLDTMTKQGEIVYIDTLKHEDALPTYLQKLDTWKTVRLELCDDKYHSRAPEFYNDQDILDLKESYRLAGELDTFYREFRNLPVAPETASFKGSYFKYYDPREMTDTFKKCEAVILMDPAKSVTPQSDWSGIVGVVIDTVNRAYYVADAFGGMVYPDQLYETTLDMANRLNASVIGYEVTGINEFIIGPFKNYVSSKGVYSVELLELKARGRKKEERIKALISFYRQGFIYHNPTATGPLEEQLLTFPYSARLDIADALAYLVPLVEAGGRYCMQEPKVNEKGKLEQVDLLKLDSSDLLEDLYYDPPMKAKNLTALYSARKGYSYGHCV